MHGFWIGRGLNKRARPTPAIDEEDDMEGDDELEEDDNGDGGDGGDQQQGGEAFGDPEQHHATINRRGSMATNENKVEIKEAAVSSSGVFLKGTAVFVIISALGGLGVDLERQHRDRLRQDIHACAHGRDVERGVLGNFRPRARDATAERGEQRRRGIRERAGVGVATKFPPGFRDAHRKRSARSFARYP